MTGTSTSVIMWRKIRWTYQVTYIEEINTNVWLENFQREETS
jgi:hypothetical protein